MRIIEDIGLKGFMGRVADVSVYSQADVLPAEEPLLIFAHKTNGATVKLSRHAGLQILERVIATCIPHRCRAMVIGFLPIRDYGEYQYLLDSRNYRQLPVDLKALAECEIPTTSEAASRRALQRQIAFAARKLRPHIGVGMLNSRLTYLSSSLCLRASNVQVRLCMGPPSDPLRHQTPRLKSISTPTSESPGF